MPLVLLFILRRLIYATPPFFATFVCENEGKMRTKYRKRGGVDLKKTQFIGF